jgi:hypothetical protein
MGWTRESCSRDDGQAAVLIANIVAGFTRQMRSMPGSIAFRCTMISPRII